ncbi:UNVERIFIED_CONTAM: hypothetical protein Sangu_2830500 [Sesamum angustifolium]|uniref:Transposase MuDR plant domain-containing protein n=1 Tax=Sesamum angustifolium TaxID=2727405 RepID=A0AAW2IQU2_9LAMI
MKEFVEELGYDKQKVRFWHQFGHNLHLGSTCLETDTDIYEIINHIGKNRVVEIFVEHLDGPKIDFSFLDNVNSYNPLLSQSSDYDMEEDDRLFEKWVDHDIEFDGEVGKGKSVDNQLFSHEMQNMIEGEHSEGGENSNEFQSVHGSDDEVTPKFPKFNPKTENKNPDLNLSLIFSSKKEAKFAIETHYLRRGMVYRFDRNDHRRLRARCKKEGCEWYVYVSPIQGDKSWQVKGYNSVHSKCSWNYNNNIRSGWLGKKQNVSLVDTLYKLFGAKMKFRKTMLMMFVRVNGAELWPKCELPPPLPPKYENKSGRPKKMRRRQPDEPPAATNTTRLKKCLKSLKCGQESKNVGLKLVGKSNNISSVNVNTKGKEVDEGYGDDVHTKSQSAYISSSWRKPTPLLSTQKKWSCSPSSSFSLSCSFSSSVCQRPPLRYAVLGAGLLVIRRLEFASNILQHGSRESHLSVDIYDEVGIGGGASGVAGGLLHPYSPKVKLLWRGAECWNETLNLLHIAEGALLNLVNKGKCETLQNNESPIVRRRGILRPVVNLKNMNIMTEGLYLACQNLANDMSTLGHVHRELHFYQKSVQSLLDLAGDYDAVIICFGARAVFLPELSGKLPLRTCRGIITHLHLGDDIRNVTTDEAAKAIEVLLPKASSVYPAIKNWTVTGAVGGLRAMPPLTADGSLPLLGCIDDYVDGSETCKYWLFTGLGARGLLFHGWLGKLLAQAVLSHDENLIPFELTSWKHKLHQ